MEEGGEVEGVAVVDGGAGEVRLGVGEEVGGVGWGEGVGVRGEEGGGEEGVVRGGGGEEDGAGHYLGVVSCCFEGKEAKKKGRKRQVESRGRKDNTPKRG